MNRLFLANASVRAVYLVTAVGTSASCGGKVIGEGCYYASATTPDDGVTLGEQGQSCCFPNNTCETGLVCVPVETDAGTINGVCKPLKQ